MALGSFDRRVALDTLRSRQFDVVIVGGGITGAGAALDAASRGLRTALVERDDFASGTSSKSSKMVHGGLRYLQQGDVRLVYEALAERQRLLENAPHLVRELPFLLPVLTRDGIFNRKIARALGSAMWMYDLTGGGRIGKVHRRISAEETVKHLPILPPDRVAAGYIYYDCAADDARLTLAIARTAAVDYGATVANRVAVTAIGDRRGERCVAVRTAEGDEFDIAARVIVNATGVWADDLRAFDEPGAHPTLRPAKGVHVTVPWRHIGNDIAAILPVRSDKRSVFIVPWGNQAYIGTTDTDYDGPIDDPTCTPDDIA
ncbi:MAG: glycerol-3-phosphate dehydrogenase/oxidase, partial [Acidimicrobiia bacterium]|nr:glycerol-3-phosphate dehydrogenase/oxidase [Acidimicrobiia bacterium]